ncbi:formylglycine-generating enzyme family protein [Marinobacter sp. KMM 10035]|uniref:formylglycine-generating enzyme family protein n=1 Tax=Marinobacter sp. KMM 10035 TaxID=3134034 RepID=UPI00397BB727
MRYVLLFVAIVLTSGCTSVTSETLSESEINAIQARVEERHPDLSRSQQKAVIDLVVRALDNMVFVEGGSFMMGEFGWPCEPASEQLCNIDIWPHNDYLHKVTLDDYYLSKYETSLGDFDLYRGVMGREPYAPELRAREDRQHLFQSNLPAWTKTWQEAKDYCLWIGKLAERSVSLPTEAQWEFAARNRGEKVRFATNNGEWLPGENAPPNDGMRRLYPVDSFPPNPLGIHHMTSNSAEWVGDWYSETYYESSPELNPSGPKIGEKKVIRSGGYRTGASSKTTILRDSRPPIGSNYYEAQGFRCGLR